MKRKILFLSMMALMMGSVSMTSCVKNEESASVTNLRDAKTKQIEAMAAVANADAAYKAALMANETALNAAKIKVAEAEAAYQMALAAGKQAEADLAKVALDKARGSLAADIEAAVATANQKRAEAEQAYSEAMIAYEKNKAELEANPYLKELMTQYGTASQDVSTAATAYTTAQTSLAGLQAGLVTAEQWVESQKIVKNAIIAQHEAALVKYSSLPTGDRAAAEKAWLQAKADEVVLLAGLKTVADPMNVSADAANKAVAALAAGDLLKTYTAAVAATQSYKYTKYDGSVDATSTISTSAGTYTTANASTALGVVTSVTVNTPAAGSDPATWNAATLVSKTGATWSVTKLADLGETADGTAIDAKIADQEYEIATAKTTYEAANTPVNKAAITTAETAVKTTYDAYLAKLKTAGASGASTELTAYNDAVTGLATAVAVIAAPFDALAKVTAEKKAWEDYRTLITGTTYSDAVKAAKAAVKANETATAAFTAQNDAVTAATAFTAAMEGLMNGTTDVEALIADANNAIAVAKAEIADLAAASNGTDKATLVAKIAQDTFDQAKLAYQTALAVMDSLKAKIDAELKK